MAADPRAAITAQGLHYAASALRAAARRPEQQAASQNYESCRALFEQSVREYDELAGKLTRIAERLSPPTGECYPERRHGRT